MTMPKSLQLAVSSRCLYLSPAFCLFWSALQRSVCFGPGLLSRVVSFTCLATECVAIHASTRWVSL